MDLVLAFIFGGLICVLFQVFFRLKPNPILILIIALCLGGILGAFGILAKLTAIGGAGVGVMIICCGEAIVGTFLGLMAGDPSGFIILAILILFSCLVLGLGAGAIEHAMRKRKKDIPPSLK